MPAKSKAARRAAAIAIHAPEQLHAKNRGLARMSLSDLMHLASTPEKGLPRRVRKKKTR